MPRPVAAGAGQGIGPSHDSIGLIGLADLAKRTGASVLELSGDPHALACQIGALVGTLAELFADERVGKTSRWQVSARRPVNALAMAQVLTGEAKARIDWERGGKQEGSHGTA